MKLKQLPTPLDYNTSENKTPENTFRISASGVSRFFTHPRQWWGENFLDEPGFTGNTASVNGTIVHFIAEQYAKNGSITNTDKQHIDNYILKHTDPTYDDYTLDIDADEINDHYKTMANTLINDYVIPNPPTIVEPFLTTDLTPADSPIKIVAGGSIDNLTNGQPLTDALESLAGSESMTICDYKSTSTKPTSLPKSIPYAYRLQLLTYAYTLKQSYNITSDRIRIIYVTKDDCGRVSEKTGKPLKSYPSEVVTLTEAITSEDYNYIESCLKLIADSVAMWHKQPEMRYLLAKDYRLKD